MAKYTLELRKLENNLFNFDYPFYDNEVKNIFEKKFINHYYFNEIGYESINAFKQQLKSYFLRVYPYYKQMYDIELRCKNIDFMLNKDLKETFIRELSNTEESNLNSELTVNNTSNLNNKEDENNTNIIKNSNNSHTINNNTTSNNSTDINYESSLSDGVASSILENGYITNSQKSENNVNEQTSVETTENNSSNSTNNTNVLKNIEIKSNEDSSQNANNRGVKTNNEKEKTTLISQGNIGVTSSAELKEKWINCIQNIDEQIIKGARYLFMYIY